MDRNTGAIIAGLIAVLIVIFFINGGIGLPELAPVERTNEDSSTEALLNREAQEASTDTSQPPPASASPTASPEPPEREPVVTDLPVSESGSMPRSMGQLQAVERDTGERETYDFMYHHRPNVGMYVVYYGERGDSAEIWRLYPDEYSLADIEADITGVAPITYDWPADTPDPEAYPEETFVTGNIIEASDFLVIEDNCRQYMSGDECAIGVLANSFELMPGRLEHDTGPYDWGNAMTLTEVRVLPEGMLFLAWAFGDGGLRAIEYSIWNTTTGTHTFVSGHSGLQWGSVSIRVAENGDRNVFAVVDHDPDATDDATYVFAEDMFAEIQDATIFAGEHCVSASPTAKDRTDPAAPWLVEYEFSCPGVGYDLATRYYELDPVRGTMTPLTDVLLR